MTEKHFPKITPWVRVEYDDEYKLFRTLSVWKFTFRVFSGKYKPSQLHSQCIGYQIWVQNGPDWHQMGAKMYWKLFKFPDLSHFVPSWSYLCPNCTSLTHQNKCRKCLVLGYLSHRCDAPTPWEYQKSHSN